MSKAPHTEARPAAPSGLIRTVTRRPTPGPARGLRRQLPDLGDTLPVLGSAPRGGPTRARAPAVWPPLPSPDSGPRARALRLQRWGARGAHGEPRMPPDTDGSWGAASSGAPTRDRNTPLPAMQHRTGPDLGLSDSRQPSQI